MTRKSGSGWNFNVSNVGYYGELSESRSTHLLVLSRVALAWFLSTPSNGKLVRRLARKENGEPSGGLHWERKGSLHSPTFYVLPTKEPGLRPQTFVFFCLNPVRHWWNNWGIFFEFYTIKPVATPPWNVQMATQKRLGDCSVYSELLRMGQRCQLGGTGLTA